MPADVTALLLQILPIALLGALLGLDMVSFPQVMIARPIVSATVGGALVGRPGAGVLMGVVLELIALETLPFGAARYAEWGSAGAVGGAVFAMLPADSAAGLPLGMLAALAAAVCSSWSMVVVRKLNVRTVRSLRTAVNVGSAPAVTTVQLRGLTYDLIRGGLVTFAALLVMVPLTQFLAARWATGAMTSRMVVVTVAATVAASAVWNLFHATARAGWYFLAGLVAGGILIVVT